MERRHSWLATRLVTTAGDFFVHALTQDVAPDALLKRLSAPVMAAIEADLAIEASDVGRTVVLHGSHIMPKVRFSQADVRSDVSGRGDSIQLDDRMEIASAGWKVHDINMLGVWLVENYRTQFAKTINAKGIDGLIALLVSRSQSNVVRAIARS